jgi:hypothetical protein
MPRVALLLVAAATMGSDCCECCPTGFTRLRLEVVDGASGCPLAATVLEGTRTIYTYCALDGVDAGTRMRCPPVPCPDGFWVVGLQGVHTWTIAAPGYRTSTLQFDAGHECGTPLEQHVELSRP